MTCGNFASWTLRLVPRYFHISTNITLIFTLHFACKSQTTFLGVHCQHADWLKDSQTQAIACSVSMPSSSSSSCSVTPTGSKTVTYNTNIHNKKHKTHKMSYKTKVKIKAHKSPVIQFWLFHNSFKLSSILNAFCIAVARKKLPALSVGLL